MAPLKNAPTPCVFRKKTPFLVGPIRMHNDHGSPFNGKIQMRSTYMQNLEFIKSS